MVSIFRDNFRWKKTWGTVSWVNSEAGSSAETQLVREWGGGVPWERSRFHWVSPARCRSQRWS